MAYKNLTREEALKIYKAVQLYGILQATTFQKTNKKQSSQPHLCVQMFF
jgi:hypothetical protein